MGQPEGPIWKSGQSFWLPHSWCSYQCLFLYFPLLIWSCQCYWKTCMRLILIQCNNVQWLCLGLYGTQRDRLEPYASRLGPFGTLLIDYDLSEFTENSLFGLLLMLRSLKTLQHWIGRGKSYRNNPKHENRKTGRLGPYGVSVSKCAPIQLT
jgi:hypothetical protein